MKKLIKRIYYFFPLIKLKRKFSFLKNKKVLIVGSAPKIDMSIGNSGETHLVSCNGSAANIQKLNLGTSTLTIIDNELIDRKIAYEKDVRSKIIKNKILKNINLGHLISVQSNHSNDLDYNMLESDIKSFTKINKNMRSIIINSLLELDNVEENVDTLISTGIFSICLCLYLGAKEVNFTGFSFFKENKDHYYDEENLNYNQVSNITRNHSLADSVTVGLLKIKGYKIRTTDKDFLPLMSNWGAE